MSSRVKVTVEEDPTPLVLAIAADLGSLLEDPAFAERTGALRGAAAIHAASGEKATIRLDGEAISVRHGLAPGADLSAVPGDGDRPRLEGESANPQLAEWVRTVLDPPAPDWRDAARRFWAALEAMPGAPTSLRVVNPDDGEDRFGSSDGAAYEIHGAAADLAAVLGGRVALFDAAVEGRVQLRGSFAQISVLSGAADAIRLGEVP